MKKTSFSFLDNFGAIIFLIVGTMCAEGSKPPVFAFAKTTITKNGECARVLVIMDPGKQLQGMVRRSTPDGRTKFYVGSSIVTEYSATISLTVEVLAGCDAGDGPPIVSKLPRMLKFRAKWEQIEGRDKFQTDEVQPEQVDKEEGIWSESSSRTVYKFNLPSAKVPLAAGLSLSIFSEDGKLLKKVVVQLSGGSNSRVPH